MGINFPLWSPSIGDVPPNLINEALGSGTTTNTSIATVGNGTLTAAALVGGQIARTGPTGAYTDTTDTAAAIVTALGPFDSGATFTVRLRNSTSFPQTIAGGTGVTWSAVTVIPPWSVGTFFGTVGGTSASPTVTFRNTSVTASYSKSAISNPIATALTTVGAGTVTAAGIASGVTLRSGSTAAFSDTTDIADNIIAAAMSSSAGIGESFVYTYVNNTVAAATLGGGTGVTVSGVTVIPPNSWARYLVTYTAADTVTMVGIEQGYFPKSGTFTALTGGGTGNAVTVADARVTATSQILITLKTVGGTVSPGTAYINTITPGTGFTAVNAASDTSTYSYVILG